MAVWAFAEKVANAMKTARQNKTTAEFMLTADLLRANDARIAKGLTFGLPSREPWLLGSLLAFKKASSQTTKADNLQHAFASGKCC